MAEGDIVRRITISATGEGIDNTTKSVESLGDALSNIGSSSELSLTALAGFGVGALASISGFVEYIAKANKELADMNTTARQVGLSVSDFQSIAFGGQVSGLDVSQINAGLTKSAQLLNEAQRNANSLSKEFEINGLSIKSANGQLITENQLLTIAGDLVRRAQTPQDENAIAQMLGFTKEWVPLLGQLSHGLDGVRGAAQDAGAIISDETIEKASEFDEHWRKSSVEWSSYMKAALSELLPYVDRLIEKGADFVHSIDSAKIQKASDESLKEFSKATGLPADDGVISINADALTQAAHEFNQQPIFSLDTWFSFGRAIRKGFSFQSGEAAAEMIPGYAASRIREPEYPTAAQMDAAFDKANPPDPGSREHPIPGLSASDYEFSKASKVAAKDNGANNRDAIDRASESLMKYVKTTQAASQSVGGAADEVERLKAMAQLEAAAEKEGIPLTSERAKGFAKLAEDAGDAALALEKAKLANSIKFSRDTAFLSQEDAQIASSLKSIYPDVATALNSAEAAQMRFNNSAKELGGIIHTSFDAMTPAIRDAINHTGSLADSFKNLGLTAVKALQDMIIKLTIIKPLENAVMGGFGGLFGGGSPSTVMVGDYAMPKFASGTDYAPGGLALVGEQGPELVNLPRGSSVLPNGKTIDALGADKISVNYSPVYNVQGSGPEIAALKSQMSKDRADFEARTIDVIRKAKAGRKL